MSKIAIINDIHSNYLLLQKILNYTRKQNIEKYIICGDTITDGVWVNEVLESLEKIDPIMVNGNREEAIINYDGVSWKNSPRFALMLYTYENISKDNLEFIKKNEITKTVTIEGIKICISHGSPYKVRDLVYHDSYSLFDRLINDFNADVYLFAHTHIPFCTKYKNKLFINAGALFPCCNKQVVVFGVLDINDKTVNYSQIELKYDFLEVKDFYLNSLTYQVSPEWCNILINEFAKGIDYYNLFADYLDKNYKTIDNNTWKEAFQRFMKEKNLDIY